MPAASMLVQLNRSTTVNTPPAFHSCLPPKVFVRLGVDMPRMAQVFGGDHSKEVLFGEGTSVPGSTISSRAARIRARKTAQSG
jgi:hypothetical protein